MSNNRVKEFFSNTINHRIIIAPIIVNLPLFDEDINHTRYSQLAGIPLKNNIIFSSRPFIFSLFSMIYMYSSHNPSHGAFNITSAILFIIICFVISALLIFYCYKIGSPQIIFNRENGLLLFLRASRKHLKPIILMIQYYISVMELHSLVLGT